MYNVLLTDDEQIVIDSLKFIINKNFEGQVNLFTALSGTEAIEIVTKESIDIIFMDINMPGLSGLDTVSCIKKLNPEIVIVMLSAFDRFQYAQEAMNLGAYKYITKPVNRNIVIQTIRSAMDFIDNKNGKVVEDDDLQKKMDLVLPMLESDFIYSCIFNNEQKFDLNAYLDYFNLSEKIFCLCCFEIPNITSENQLLNYKKIREVFTQEAQCLLSSFIMNRIAILFAFKQNTFTSEELNKKIKKCYTELNYKISSGIRCGVSRVCEDWSLLKSSYNEALSCLIKTESNGGIIFAESDLQNYSKINDNSLEFKKQLIARFRQGDFDGVKSFLELFCSYLINKNTDINKIKNSFIDILVTTRNITTEINESFYSDSFDDAFSILSKEDDIQMLKDYLYKTLLEYMNAIESMRTQNEHPIVKKVCDYINQNLALNISLESMAEYVNVSSFYLSKLFKEEKGVTFINFLSDKRLEKSRAMLKDTDLSIKEITAQTGYNDQNYFSRLFKNKFGVSPSEYRNQL